MRIYLLESFIFCVYIHIRKLPAPILFRICVFVLVISFMSAGLFRFFDFFQLSNQRFRSTINLYNKNIRIFKLYTWFRRNKSTRSQILVKIGGILKNFTNFTEKHLRWSLFLKNCRPRNSRQVFFCEICEIFKNTYFCRTPPEAASVDGIFQKCI